jgi:hypothetical protein
LEEKIKNEDYPVELSSIFGKIIINRDTVDKIRKLTNYDKEIFLSGLLLDIDHIKKEFHFIIDDIISVPKVNIQSINKMYGKNYEKVNNVFIWDEREELFIGIETLIQAVARAGRGDKSNKLVNCYIPESYYQLFTDVKEGVLEKMDNYVSSENYISEKILLERINEEYEEQRIRIEKQEQEEKIKKEKNLEKLKKEEEQRKKEKEKKETIYRQLENNRNVQDYKFLSSIDTMNNLTKICKGLRRQECNNNNNCQLNKKNECKVNQENLARLLNNLKDLTPVNQYLINNKKIKFANNPNPQINNQIKDLEEVKHKVLNLIINLWIRIVCKFYFFIIY